MPRALEFDVIDRDLAYAHKQDRWACAVVRAIQRTYPEATRVVVDKKNIVFSMDTDEMRYRFETPQDLIRKVIKPLDQGKDVKPGRAMHFVVDHAIESWPMMKTTPAERAERRAKQSPTMRTRKRTSQNVNVRQINRFVDDTELAEEIANDA